ncbi:MAG TPA: peptide-binding protein [Cyanobacteria bacterium UBA8553]|nr:peptide-binding protein [Cyanobacteria bacterium UBA8553]HAJ60526.1 peptide-binding protein [Cyanobacteria bacterium UBA8543]
MIVCPNCNHQNPDGAIQCEACYTPLPATTSCPNCGATVQTDASFCGQCGFNLSVAAPLGGEGTAPPISPPDVPDLVNPDPLVQPEPMAIGSQLPDPEPNLTSPPIPSSVSPLPATMVNQPSNTEAENESSPDPAIVVPPLPSIASEPEEPQKASSSPPPLSIASPGSARTQLQIQSVSLLHVQTNTRIEFPQNLSVVHVGKPNDQIPPDIDVSGFPNSEIVSRIHADIRVEGDAYYIEDVGSSNGTYVNHTPLPRGNRHRLRPGDRISLGKGDQMTFLFQSS